MRRSVVRLGLLVTIWSAALPVGASESALASLQAAPDDATRIAVLRELAQQRAPDAAPGIAAFLDQGQQHDAVTDAALEALEALASPASRVTLERLTGHRRVAARLRAYAALAKLPGTEVDALLARGLRDIAPEVRTHAAHRLGERRAVAHLDELFLALERGVHAAGAAIGSIGDERAVPRLHAQLGKAPLEAMLAGYRALLCRRDISLDAKLDILAKLEDTSGGLVHAFLLALQPGRDCSMSERVHRAALRSAQRTRERKAAPSEAR